MKISKPIIIDGEEMVTTRNEEYAYWEVGLHTVCSECGYILRTTAIPDQCPNCLRKMVGIKL